MHSEQSEYAGKIVKLKPEVAGIGGKQYRVEDWWDRVAGRSWMNCDGNPACLDYAARSAFAGLPTDNEVLYGKVGYPGHLVHISEIEPLTEECAA
jgi:hypothetical protein